MTLFADLYRQEVVAAEDVHRTLPFFGTALGIVIGALAYAAGRLPRLPELSSEQGRIAFGCSMALLAMAVIEAACVLGWLARAIARHDYRRIGPEEVFRTRVGALRTFHANQGVAPDQTDGVLLNDLRQVIVDSYAETTPTNRGLNQRAYLYRARAGAHLVRSLMWALAASTLIFTSDKIGWLPR